MDTPSKAAEIMRHYAEHDEHGYTQGGGRWGTGTEPLVLSDGSTVTIPGGDGDCSAGDVRVYIALGVDVGGATFTGDMRQCMTSTGNFRWHPMSDGYIARPGDIYLNERDHTAMCISDNPDLLAEFYIDENGGIIGGQPGDQTGKECRVAPYYDFPWDGILECLLRGDDDMPTPEEIWAYQINGVQARDRLIGIDLAANSAKENTEAIKNEVMRTDDPTGRGQEIKDHDHIKWIAAKLDKMSERLDAIDSKLE